MRYIQASLHKTQHSFPIALVVALFNQDITQELLQGALRRLRANGFTEEDLTVVEVPGAVELPLIAQYLAHQKQYGAIILFGAVIRGETTHYDYVCQQVSYGCQRVALDTETPVIFGVLTTENEEQALARSGGEQGHKGRDAADTAVSMIDLMQHEDCACAACE